MENENAVEYAKYSQYMAGQFRRTSKKNIALFIGRSIQTLRESLEPFIEPKKLKIETLRFAVVQRPLTDGKGEEIQGWDLVIVAYEVGSNSVLTEEDKQAIEERRKKREEEQENGDKEIGEAAMKELDRMIYQPGKGEGPIQ